MIQCLCIDIKNNNPQYGLITEQMASSPAPSASRISLTGRSKLSRTIEPSGVRKAISTRASALATSLPPTALKEVSPMRVKARSREASAGTSAESGSSPRTRKLLVAIRSSLPQQSSRERHCIPPPVIPVTADVSPAAVTRQWSVTAPRISRRPAFTARQLK